MDTYGYSECVSQSSNKCYWPYSFDCLYGRISLSNPTETGYLAFRCPEWEYTSQLEATIHLGNNVTTQVINLHPGISENIDGITFSLNSTSIPSTPLLSDCIMQQGQHYSVIACNERGEYVANKIGEYQCSSLKSAQKMAPDCIGSTNLVRSTIDTFGINCEAQLIDPHLIMENNRLPLRLDGGVLIPFDNTVIFESSANSLLEVQISTSEAIHIIKQTDDVLCEAETIGLDGTYGTLAGATLIIKAKSNIPHYVAMFECTEHSVYSSIHVTNTWADYTLTLRLGQPEIDMNCTLKCARQITRLRVKGHLHYLPNKDLRSDQTDISYIPTHSTVGLLDGFNLFSFIGSSYSTYIYRIVIILLLYVSFSLSMKMILKKIL